MEESTRQGTAPLSPPLLWPQAAEIAWEVEPADLSELEPGSSSQLGPICSLCPEATGMGQMRRWGMGRGLVRGSMLLIGTARAGADQVPESFQTCLTYGDTLPQPCVPKAGTEHLPAQPGTWHTHQGLAGGYGGSQGSQRCREETALRRALSSGSTQGGFPLLCSLLSPFSLSALPCPPPHLSSAHPILP